MFELHNLEQTVRALPPAAQRELRHFIRYLRYKYQPQKTGDIVKLGGLWANVDLDLSDADVRALRQHITHQLLGKV